MYTEQHLFRLPKPFFRLAAIAIDYIIYCLQAFRITNFDQYRVALKNSSLNSFRIHLNFHAEYG